MYDVYVYASPGYMDMWSIRYWLYRVTVAAKKTLAWTRIWVIGSGGKLAVAQFCRDYHYTWETVDAPHAKKIPDAVKALKGNHERSPDVLLAFTRGGEVVWDYATLAIEQGIDVVLTARLSGEQDN